MGRPPCVSVVMPVFNAAGTLARAVESVRRQTLENWELVVADDGSSDGTANLLSELARREPRARVISLPHRGLVPALNAALAQAEGRFIARMDADDESHPERLAAQVEWLEQHPVLGMVGSLVEFGGDRLAAGGYALHVEWMNGLVTPEEVALNRFIESPFAHPSVMFRREVVERQGGYREGDFPEDYELWLRWLEAGVQMGKVERVLLTWHDPPGRLSRTHPRYDTEAFYRCKSPFLSRWLQEQVRPSRPILVWGAGRPTRKRAGLLGAHGVKIDGYIDIDPHKQGRCLGGCRVLSPKQIPGPSDVFVLGYVAKRGARELARAHLTSRGFQEGRDFLMAA
jgi:glycosyltransferase involved in cell wall biosynthesis